MTKELIEVHDALLEWCHRFTGKDKPAPTTLMHGYFESLAIGDIVVWDSECGYGDNQENTTLTVEGAIRSYKHEMANLTAWPK